MENEQVIKRLAMQAERASDFNGLREGKYPVVFPKPKCLKKMIDPNFNRYESDPKGTLINEDGSVNIDVIRYELQWDRFDMSGYDANMGCDRWNNDLLERFRKYGIFNRVAFYYITAYKGNMIFHFLPWRSAQAAGNWDWSTEEHISKEFCGKGTVEILIDIFSTLYKYWEGNYRRLG